MQTKLQLEIPKILAGFSQYWENEVLLKNKVIEDLRAYKEPLLNALLSNELIKESYSITIDENTIFKLEEFISTLRFKEYWENSYTKYSNEVGLTSEGKYLKYNADVVLDFPYKDAVLEGGMTQEDLGKDEIFYHQILAKEEIDVLFSPKALTNITKFDSEGEHKVNEINDKDNLIIKGNNLIALYTLKKRYAGKVKLIYIDPPYNTGGDSFQYNDRYNHSTWLTFMKNRLSIAKEFLTEGGSMWINIGDEEVHYLKVLLDEIFPSGFVANVLWQKRTSPDARATIGGAHDHILVYTNNTEIFKKSINNLPLTEEQKTRFQNPDNDPKGPWVSSDYTAQGFRPNQMYKIVTPSGKEYYPPTGKCWKNIESEYLKQKEDGRMWYGKNGDGMPRRKTYLAESPGQVAWTWWENKEVGHSQEAKKESINLFGEESPFSTPKPERLLYRIINLCTNEKDIVLDFFMGSGTTQAVAHKTNRQYIGIEQMDYIKEFPVTRLKKVIQGEKGGISKAVEWNGGGSFIFAELQKLNQVFVEKIQRVRSMEQLSPILDQMKEHAFLDYKIDMDKLTFDNEEFASLSLTEQKDILIKTLDGNQLYLSYSEIEDEQYEIPKSIQNFNHSFYERVNRL